MCTFIHSELFIIIIFNKQSVTHFSGLVLTLIADWCWLAPESVTFSTVFAIWKTIIGFGAKGRALVLANLFEILDKDLIPQQRTISIFIKKNIFWFLGENGNILVDEIPAHYKGSVSPDVSLYFLPFFIIFVPLYL